MNYSNPNDYWQPRLPNDESTRAIVIIIICGFAVIGFMMTVSIILGVIFG